MAHPDLLEGHAKFSDAGVFRLRPDLAIVQSVDFFPPVVDSPWDYGRIAAANSLSDLYAMGATPVTALNVAGFPAGKLDLAVLAEIFTGGAEKVLEAGAVLVGGHTVEDKEVKFGLSVTGTVHPQELVTNGGARPGDLLVLTKPLGMGSVTTALKKGRVPEPALKEAIEIMATLNRDASTRMVELRAHGATDITGYGFLGHAFELAEASGVTVCLDPDRVPCLAEAERLARRGLLSGGASRNRSYLEGEVTWKVQVPPHREALLFDAETSGGLLVALAPEDAEILVSDLAEWGHRYAAIVGRVGPRGETPLEIGPLE